MVSPRQLDPQTPQRDTQEMTTSCNAMNAARAALILLTISSATSLHSQQAIPTPTGSVMGFVDDDQTKLHLRFAEIRLIPKPTDPGPEPAKQQTDQTEPHLTHVSGFTGMDGSFRLDAVPVGDYLVAALKPAYVTPGTAVAFDTPEDKLKGMIAALPSVHIGAGQVATLNLTLHRGAVISGRMQYADGSPAIGMTVVWGVADDRAFHPEFGRQGPSPRMQALQNFDAPQQQPVTTNDEGRFRIFGLQPGKYMVSTAIALDHNTTRVSMTDGEHIPKGREVPEVIGIYAPGVFRRDDARIIEIKGDEQITDADLTIAPESLHAIGGKVLAAATGQNLGQGMVVLRENKAKDFGRFALLQNDGSFQFNYLPPGTYTVEIMANDAHPPTDTSTDFSQVHEYKTVRVSAIVSDHDILMDNILMVPLQPGEKNQ
jgi:hypothetical protein